MNYRHLYHAGNFSDVFKHLILLSLLEYLLRKDKPFTYMETHAGIGFYDLYKPAPQKSREFSVGILKLWNKRDQSLPELVTEFLDQVYDLNKQHGSEKLRYYPGSPCLARKILRPNDRMILCELHARDVIGLKNTFKADSQVAVHHMNGYQGLKAFLPPRPARGLVFLDPSYEQADEFEQIARYLQEAWQRWPTGMFAVWYPMQKAQQVDHFYQTMRSGNVGEIVCCEFSLPFSVSNLTACGMMIVNPPWQWKDRISQVLQWLNQVLSEPVLGGHCRVFTLNAH